MANVALRTGAGGSCQRRLTGTARQTAAGTVERAVGDKLATNEQPDGAVDRYRHAGIQRQVAVIVVVARRQVAVRRYFIVHDGQRRRQFAAVGAVE